MNIPKTTQSRAEIIILTEFVEMSWSGAAITIYKQLGYKYTGIHQKFMVPIQDLSHSSSKRVLVKCPFCERERLMAYSSAIRSGHTLCKHCTTRLDLTNISFGRLTAISPHIAKDKRGTYWLCKCECGNETTTRASALINGTTSSCGCYHKEVFQPLRGSESHLWNPNLTDDERERARARDRKTPENKEWINTILSRDNYTCQACGKRGVKLEVHHLYSYSNYPKKQLDIDNGVALCKKHHREFHGWMGGCHVACTPSDFYQWLNVPDKHK